MKSEFIKLGKESIKAERSPEAEMAYVENLLEKLVNKGDIVKRNEGNNGIILEIDLDSFTEEERDAFCDYFNISYELGVSRAIKMLKIFKSNEAKREFGLQMQTAELINNNEDINTHIGVPEIYFGGEISVNNDGLREKLKEFGVKFTDGNNLGLMMMDFVEGEDFGAIFYKLAIQEKFREFKEMEGLGDHATKEDLPLYLVGKSVEDLALICGRLLNLNFEENDKNPETTVAAEERKENTRIIMEVISHKGLIEGDNIPFLRKAINLMHKNGIYHCDLHQRNIINGSDGKFYIVDFGEARIVNPNNESERKTVYERLDGKRSSDKGIVLNLEQVAITPEMLLMNRIEKNLDVPLTFKRSVLRSETSNKKLARDKMIYDAWINFYKGFEKGDNLNNLFDLLSKDLKSNSNIEFLKIKLEVLLLLIEKNKEESVENFCNEMLKKDKLETASFNKFKQIKEMALLHKQMRERKDKNKKNAT